MHYYYYNVKVHNSTQPIVPPCPTGSGSLNSENMRKLPNNGPWQRQKDNLYFFGKSADIETGERTRQEQITGTENSEFDLRLSVKLNFSSHK